MQTFTATLCWLAQEPLHSGARYVLRHTARTVKAKVLKVNPFGLFVELDPDIHGLAHISELSYKPITDVSEIAKEGDELKFKILTIEPKNHRLGLSIKALTEAPKKEEPKAEATAPVVEQTEEEK